ncbi:MAG: PspC domain-containing protein [Lentimicrobiaceae bacterium]|nr:PspC domain-containing protein [Lentimicrobiaceae bacterium]
MYEYKKLERNPMNKVIGGVCSGLAEYFNLDVALVRVLFVIALLFASFGFWLYVILWIVIPERKISFDFNNTQQSEDQNQQYEDQSSDVTAEDNKQKTTTVFAGVFVVLIGVIFLINNFIPISWVWKLWPLVLVSIGVIMIVNASKKN